MSRVGKKIIKLPKDIETQVTDTMFVVKGKFGELSVPLKPFVKVNIENDELSLTVQDEKNRVQKAIWGTLRALIANSILGVTEKFKKEVELNGVGYKMELANELTLYIGYSHPVKVQIPKNISLTLNKNVLSGESIDKQALGDFFTTIHNMKPCDVYKHKGFKFPGRFYAKKVGKKAK